MSSGPILVFACRWCSLLGAERAARERLPLPDGLRIIPIDCAGSVSPEKVLEALLNGAAGVAVMGCHMGGCRHNDANRDAHVRISVLKDLLDAVGLDGRRLLVSWGDAHEAKGFSDVLQKFAYRLSQLPDLPLPQALPAHAAVPVMRPRPLPTQEQDEDLREKARQALKNGFRVLALGKGPLGTQPALFADESGLDAITAGCKHPMAKLAWRILKDQAAGALTGADAEGALRTEFLDAAPEKPLAVACRACDARALRQQAALNQFAYEPLEILRIECSEEQKKYCACADCSWPDEEPAPCVEASAEAPRGREFWEKEFSRCVQCHWCSQACPVCICPSCSLDGNAMLPAGSIPPSPLGYHLARAMHVADACVNCGACQDACPQGLPLLLLHKAVSRSLKKAGYASGRGKASPMLRQRLLAQADKNGIVTPRWGSDISINAETPLER